MNFVDKALYKLGYLSIKEAGLKDIPAGPMRDQMRHHVSKSGDLRTLSNPNDFWRNQLDSAKLLEQIDRTKPLEGIPKQALQSMQKSFVVRGAADLFGYRPAGVRIWNYFANPFGVFAYIHENFHAVRMCVDLVADRVTSDGAILKGAAGVSVERLIEVYKLLKEHKILELRTEIIKHLQVYGNAYVLPHKNKYKGVKEFELLYPNRLLPVFNRITEEIIEYEYIVGRMRFIYGKDAIHHCMGPSIQGKWVGTPPLCAAVTDIEAALQAQIVNNQFFQKGCMLQGIVAMEDPEDSSGMATGPNSDWVREVQNTYDEQKSGIYGSNDLMFMNKIRDFFPLSKVGGMDTSFIEGIDHTAKYAAYLLGVPSEKIGINRSSNLQYQAAMIEDVLNCQFNDTIANLTSKTDKFINEFFLPALGVNDVILETSGGFGAITLAASQAIVNFASVGMFTRNEINRLLLRQPPLPPDDPRGNRLLDTSVNRQAEGVLPAEVIADRINPDLDLLSHKGAKFLNPYPLKMYLGSQYDGHIYRDR